MSTRPPYGPALVEDVSFDVIDPTPSDENPNEMSEDEFRGLVASIRLTTFAQPIALSRSTKTGRCKVIDGNHRIRALELLGDRLVRAIVYADLDDGQLRALRKSLNRWRGRQKPELEQADVRAMAAAGWEQLDLSALTGIAPDALAELLLPPAAATITEQLPDIPDPTEPNRDAGDEREAKTAAMKMEIAFSSDEAREEIALLLKKCAKRADARGKFRWEAALRWALGRALLRDLPGTER